MGSSIYRPFYNLLWLNGVRFSFASLTTWMYLGLISSSLNTGNDPGVVSLPKQDSFIPPRFPFRSTTVIPVNTGKDERNILSTEEWCDSIRGLVEHQVSLCKRSPAVFRQISYAARLTLQECQHQFRNEIWNCSIAGDKHIFHKQLLKGTKETAFITALSSASLVEAVVRGCSSGNIGNCSCDNRSHIKSLSGTEATWKWGGCSENVDYGLAFARQFNDAPEEVKRQDARSVKDAMHLHNKAVGRIVFRQFIEKKCRCHGVSGSCEMRTCWKQLSSFRNISTAMKSRYDKAVPIARKFNGKLKRKGKAKKKGPISLDSLVYLERSPNYCKLDYANGIRGTSGRTCNATFNGPGSCNYVCCNRGHQTQVVRKIERCYCKFIYCCKVECKECKTTKEISTCN